MDPTQSSIRNDTGAGPFKPELALRSLQLCFEASKERSNPEREFPRPLEQHLREFEQTAARFLAAYLTSSSQSITSYPLMGSLAIQPESLEPIPGPWLDRTATEGSEVLQ